MGLPRHIGSYSRHKAELDRAMVNPQHGVKIVFDSEGKAIRFRQMCYGYRRIVQKMEGGESPYDELVVAINGKEIHIKRQDYGIVESVALDGVEEVPEMPTSEDFKRVLEESQRQEAMRNSAAVKSELLQKMRERWMAAPDRRDDEPMYLWHTRQKLMAEGITEDMPEWRNRLANAMPFEGEDVI